VSHKGALTVDPVQPNGVLHFLRHSIGRLLIVLALTISFGAGTITQVAAQATPAASPAASPIAIDPLGSAVAWLLAQQDAGGGFPGFSGEPDAGTTIDAVLALATVPGIDPAVIDSAIAFLDTTAAEYAANGPGQAAKLVLVLAATGGDVTSINGINPVEQVKNGLNADTGMVGTGIFDQALAVLALASAKETVPAEWIATLNAKQAANGGWAFDGSTEDAKADSNTTALVIQALIATGVAADDAAIAKGVAFLDTLKATDAGYAYGPADPLLGDANSTGIVIQALASVDADVADATTGLVHFQNTSGAFRYMDSVPDDNLFATVQAIIALTGTPYPVLPAA
jgi:hypothetical protein